MLGIILTAIGSAFGSTALWIGAGLMSLAVLFSIVTLPVEFDASSRAMKQITALNIVNEKEYKHARKVLSAAAMTCCGNCCRCSRACTYYFDCAFK